MRTEKEIREKLSRVNSDLARLEEMYDNNEISEDGYNKSHKTLCSIITQLEWVLGENIG